MTSLLGLAFSPSELTGALQNLDLQGIVGDRLGSLVGRSSGYIESLPPHIKRRLEGLKGLQVDHTKIEAEFQKEILELEKKYATRYAPLYERRSAIVNGKEEPTKEEVLKGEASEADEEDDEDEAEEKTSYADVEVPADAEKGIPEFWLTALKNHVALSELIEEKDEEALKALIDVRMTYLTDASGFKLEFVFDPSKNEFFTNKSLTKTYYYQDEIGYSGDLVYDHAEGCEIDWKEGKDLTHKVETKKQRNKNTNQTRTVKRSVPTSSVFNFFNPPKPPKGDDADETTDFDEIDERLELDYQIGEDLKDRIIPRAVDYFSGKALAYEDLDDEDFEDEDEDEDDEEDDDDEEERPRSTASQMAGSQDPQECKHQ